MGQCNLFLHQMICEVLLWGYTNHSFSSVVAAHMSKFDCEPNDTSKRSHGFDSRIGHKKDLIYDWHLLHLYITKHVEIKSKDKSTKSSNNVAGLWVNKIDN